MLWVRSQRENSWDSRQGCDTSIGMVSLKDASLDIRIYHTIGVVGFVFIVIFNVIASFTLLQVLLKVLSQRMEASNHSFDSYGMFWGTSAILCPALIVLLYEDITHVCRVSFSVRQSEYVKYMWPFVLPSPMIICAPVAIYFGVKFNLATPSVYLLPAKLLCCCSKNVLKHWFFY